MIPKRGLNISPEPIRPVAQKGQEPCSEESALTSQILDLHEEDSQEGDTLDRVGFWFPLPFPQIRFTLKSQFSAAENRMGFLFPLSCLLLLAFRSAQTARLVTRVPKLIKTQRPVQARTDKPGSQRSSPLVTPGPQLPAPPATPRAPPSVVRLPPLPAPTPHSRQVPEAGGSDCAVWAVGALPQGHPPRRKPPGRSARRAFPPRRVQIHARLGGRVSALSPPSAAAASPRRVEKRRRREGSAAGAGSRLGRSSADAPARLRLNLGTAAGHSPSPAEPPPHSTPPNSPPPTRAPRPGLGPRTLEAASPNPLPWICAHLPRSAVFSPLLGTMPRSAGHCLVS